jgi:RNA polymerase sigma-54 factor
MEVDLGQDNRQEQKIGPQQFQGLKLLQASSLELAAAVSRELESNPLLEEAEDHEEPYDPEHERELANRTQDERFSEITITEKIREHIGWETYWGPYSESNLSPWKYNSENDSSAPEDSVVYKSSLSAHLFWQLRSCRLRWGQEKVGMLIIENLDMNGYLRATVDELTKMAKSSKNFVKDTLRIIQQFDPTGVAARDLQECLLLQAKNLVGEYHLVTRLIENYLDDLAKRNYSSIAKATGRSLEEIREAVRIITRFDPKPGLRYNDERIQYIVPDIFVYEVDNDFFVAVNRDGLPKLRITPHHRLILSKEFNADESTKEYVEQKLKSAIELINGVQRRETTLNKVANSIVKFQKEFFEDSTDKLKPLTHQEVADDIGVSRSTVSRAVANKYIHTPHGLFELKYFFNAPIVRIAGSATTSESVKERIRQIVRDEDPQRPYSDKKIAEILESEGFEIDRRTVTNYRQKLGILRYNLRKQPIWSRKKAASSG